MVKNISFILKSHRLKTKGKYGMYKLKSSFIPQNTKLDLIHKFCIWLEYELNIKSLLSLNKIPVEELISNIKVAIKNLDITKSEEIRQDIAKILRTSKPPASNISIKEKRALNNLRKNKNIVILNVDKGNATVIMNIIDYDNKMEEHLNKSGCYKIISKDPSEKIMHKVIKKNQRIITWWYHKKENHP